eukprot:13626015-Alexandrium_andersonii.AAC.1
MSASLVGSEMCIRDSERLLPREAAGRALRRARGQPAVQHMEQGAVGESPRASSHSLRSPPLGLP